MTPPPPSGTPPEPTLSPCAPGAQPDCDARGEAIFHEALARTSEQREAFITVASEGNESLQTEVQRLLAAHEQAGAFFEPPHSPQIEAERARLKPEESGKLIGPYRIIEQIGEGGFGAVWIAEQTEPMRRRVALKILKPGMDTKEVLARFEQERQALALMDHPSIARVFDAGATQLGRPFIVMELVSGVKITEFCDKANLSLRARLELFMAVCHAVQHAHQKGVIHRDLKPSNILVTLQDGVPVPKVIDFGVAKAVQQRLSDLTVHTHVEQMIGTPPYMSPEQAEAGGLNVDTRTDIYALGVLLYELLTSRTPFDAATLLNAGPAEMRCLIREKEPPKPSTALFAMALEILIDVARHRQCDPPALIHAVRGDLDWIVMKALEKERARRYETANGFARDVQRHLRCEPVIARPPSRGYRFGRLVRRNQLIFTAAAAVAAALIVGLGVATVSLYHERQARFQAQAALDQESAIAEFLTRVTLADPEGGENRDLLDRAAARLASQKGMSPRMEAVICFIIGTSYLNENEMERALPLLERAVEARRAILGANNPETLHAMRYLGLCYQVAGKWASAAEVGRGLLDNNPGDSVWWLELAPLLVASGNELAYRRLCSEMLGRFGQTQDAAEAERTCRVCLLLPSAVELSLLPEGPLAAALDGGTAPVEMQAWAWAVRGLLAYRKGDAALALEYVSRSTRQTGGFDTPAAKQFRSEFRRKGLSTEGGLATGVSRFLRLNPSHGLASTRRSALRPKLCQAGIGTSRPTRVVQTCRERHSDRKDSGQRSGGNGQWQVTCALGTTDIHSEVRDQKRT